MTKTRLEAFSDGVFAIVITLLILDVRFPADQPLTLETLLGVARHVLAFVLSFVIVGVYWVAHHNMLHFVKRVDRQLLWLNLFTAARLRRRDLPQHPDGHKSQPGICMASSKPVDLPACAQI